MSNWSKNKKKEKKMTAGGFQTFPKVHLEEMCLLTNTRTSQVCTLVCFFFLHCHGFNRLRYCELTGFLSRAQNFHATLGLF